MTASLDDLSEILWHLATTKMCFVAGTKVHTPDGLKNIEDIQAGDLVLSRSDEDDATGEVVISRVDETFVTHPNRLVKLSFQTPHGEEELTCTPGHPFYIPPLQRFLPAGDLAVGTKVALADHGTAEVIAKEALKTEDGDGFTTFNFAVEGTRTYFVGESAVWVHNTGTVCQRLAASYYDDLANGKTPEKALQRVEAKLDSLWQQNRISKAERDKHLRDVHDEVHSPIKLQGRWEDANESMSDRARDYQEQITGRRGKAYVIEDVHFDGVEFGVLLEVKGLGYATFVRNGRFLPFFEGADKMLRQARSQLRVANGNPIRWHVAEQETATAIRNLFDDNGVFGIEVVHTPVIP